MFRKNNFIVFIVLFLFVRCDLPTSPSYYTTENGLKYEYHDIVTNGRKPIIGDYLNMYMELKSLSDTVYYSSINTQQFGIESFRLKESDIKGGIHEGLLSIMEGDSVTFYVKPNDFYYYYLNSIPPDHFVRKENIKITIRLISVKDSIEQIEYKKEQLLKLKMKEEIVIEDIVKEWKNEYDTVFEYGDIYIIPLISTNNDSIVNDGKVQVDYSTSLPNGNVIYSTFSIGPDEFDMEAEGQMLVGFKYILRQLKYNEHILALVPSYMGFGLLGKSELNVPPYTPLIFEIKVNGKVED